MNILPAFAPRAILSQRETSRGMRVGIWQVAAAGGLDGLTSGGFLVALHIFAGVATAGINLTDMTLRMKLAPGSRRRRT